MHIFQEPHHGTRRDQVVPGEAGAVRQQEAVPVQTGSMSEYRLHPHQTRLAALPSRGRVQHPHERLSVEVPADFQEDPQNLRKRRRVVGEELRPGITRIHLAVLDLTVTHQFQVTGSQDLGEGAGEVADRIPDRDAEPDRHLRGLHRTSQHDLLFPVSPLQLQLLTRAGPDPVSPTDQRRWRTPQQVDQGS